MLDSKMNWNTHLKYIIRKSKVTLWQCGRIFGINWGLSSKVLTGITGVMRTTPTQEALFNIKKKYSSKQQFAQLVLRLENSSLLIEGNYGHERL